MSGGGYIDCRKLAFKGAKSRVATFQITFGTNLFPNSSGKLSRDINKNKMVSQIKEKTVM